MNTLTEAILRLAISKNKPIPYLDLPGDRRERLHSVTVLVCADYVRLVRTGDVSTIEWTGKVA